LPTTQSGEPWTKLRTPLARAEPERLRPYRKVRHPGPGRSGDLDLGTIIQTDVNQTTGALSAWLDSMMMKAECDCPAGQGECLAGFQFLFSSYRHPPGSAGRIEAGFRRDTKEGPHGWLTICISWTVRDLD